MDLLATFGRFHVLLLHLPIGLIAGVAVLEALSLRGGSMVAVRGVELGAARGGMRVLLWLLAAAAVLTATAGYVLSLQGYVGETLSLHMWLGICVAALSVLSLAAHERVLRAARTGKPVRAPLMLFRVTLLCTVGLTFPAGHLGGTLTHGDNFLFTTSSNPAEGPAARPADARGPIPAPSVFSQRIEPILASNCYGCHGSDKQKGGLALHSAGAILAGGKHGPIISAGKPSASELIRRLRLPVDDKKHMPPTGKPQPSEEQIVEIERWITEGAALGGLESASISGPLDIEPNVSNAGPAAGRSTATPENPNQADPAAIEALRSALAHVQEVEPGSPLLWVDFAAPASAGQINDDRVSTLLSPLAANIQDLSLARSGITDATAALLARMPSLRRLNLSRTAFTDAGVAAMGSHPSLEELNLVGTSVTDASTSQLAAIPTLRRVYLWGTKTTRAGTEALRASRPDLQVESGEAPTGNALETEPPPTLSKGAAAAPTASTAVSPEPPLNTTCPVSGSPADPRYVIIFEGRRIAFCCPNCPKKFWDSPAQYLSALDN
jgi:mono/diheme cytochrome c family protein